MLIRHTNRQVRASWCGKSLVGFDHLFVAHEEGVHDEVVLTLLLFELGEVGGVRDAGGSEVVELLLFVGFGGEGGDFHAQFGGVLHGEVAQAADAEHGAPVSGVAVALDGHVDCQASTKQRCRLIQWQVFGDGPCPVMFNLHMRSIPPKPPLPIRKHPLRTQVRPATLTILTLQAALPNRTHPNNIPHLLIRHILPHHRDLAHDLVSRTARVLAETPAAPNGEDVRTADGGVEDFEADLVGGEFGEFEGVHGEGAGGVDGHPGDGVGLFQVGFGVHEMVELGSGFHLVLDKGIIMIWFLGGWGCLRRGCREGKLGVGKGNVGETQMVGKMDLILDF